MAALVVLADVSDAAVLAAARHGLQQFGSALCLQAQQRAAPLATVGAASAAPPPRLVLGLCNLAKPPQSFKPVLQVRYRPAPFILRDFHAAVSRLQPAGGDSANTITAATAAAALQQLVGMVAQDAACAAAASVGGQKSVLYLTDRMFDPDDFRPCLEVCRGKGVQVEMLFMSVARTQEEGGPSGGGGGATAALAAAWEAAEAAFPHLSVTLVEGASKLSFDALASTLLQRCGSRQQQLAVDLQFRQPLVGSICSLQLTCAPEISPLSQAVEHAALCPCHRAPTCVAWAAPTCAISGAPLDRRQCSKDERTVQVGSHPAGALHLNGPFNIANVAGRGSGSGGGPASLCVIWRVKVEQANPALLFGVPLVLAAAQPSQCFKVVHDGELADLTTQQLLELVCASLSASNEALLATCTTDLECGRSGLLRLHYLLLPCAATNADSGGGSGRKAALCAKRVACAEELLAPLLAPAAAGGAAGMLVPPSAAVVGAVASQLARVPLTAQLDPLSLSSRSSDMIEMLVRESQAMPRMQVPAAATAAAAGAAAGTPGSAPAAAAVEAAAGPVGPPPVTAQPAAAGGRTGLHVPAPARARKPAAAGAAASGGGTAARVSRAAQRAGGSRQQGATGKTALEFKRSSRR